MQRLKKLQYLTFELQKKQGCKVTKAAKSDFLASTLLNLGSMEGGGGEINTSALNCVDGYLRNDSTNFRQTCVTF